MSPADMKVLRKPRTDLAHFCCLEACKVFLAQVTKVFISGITVTFGHWTRAFLHVFALNDDPGTSKINARGIEYVLTDWCDVSQVYAGASQSTCCHVGGDRLSVQQTGSMKAMFLPWIRLERFIMDMHVSHRVTLVCV